MTEYTFRLGKKTGQAISWHATSLERSNACCVYCGTMLRGSNPPESDKEHLIARNFIPKGMMNDHSFNFIFRACRPCNARKADAERHISSVTIFNSPSRLEDSRVDEIAIRKGNSDFHPEKKGVLIKDAHEQILMNESFGTASLSVEMTSPPQPSINKMGEVAFCHIQGLFALICTEDYQDPVKMRLLPQEQFVWYDYYPHSDWGNPQAIEIVSRVRDWECVANITSAQGYFRVIMRRSQQGWFWALEWNRQLRIFGGIGEVRMKLFEELPNEGWKPTPQGRMRRNVPLDVGDDQLFTGVVSD